MKQTLALSRLQSLGHPVFITRDVAALLDVNPTNASKILTRLAQEGFIMRLTRGCWCLTKGINRLAIPEYLTVPYPAYISLQTALYHHGIISQIPVVTYAVSLARTKRHQTPMGIFSIHHMDAGFFFGYELTGAEGIKMATPEKALLDIFYLSPTRSRLFVSLPETEIPASFQWKPAYDMLKRLKSSQRRTLVLKRLKALQSGGNH